MARKTSLTRAQLVIMEPPAQAGAKPGARLASVKFQFNPNALALTKNTEWRRNPSRMALSFRIVPSSSFAFAARASRASQARHRSAVAS